MDSEIVIACHCERLHAQMYHLKNGALDKVVGANYVDPECPETTWGDIEAESKTYVWGDNCPVGPQIRSGEIQEDCVLINILDESWRVLKKGGKVIFPGPYNTTMEEPMQALIDSGAFKHKWSFSVIKNEHFPFVLTHKNKVGDFKVPPYLAIFTKPMSGGKSKRKTLKRKRRSRPVKPAL